MSLNAQAEKDSGNASFRAGKFPESVGHYSAAIFLDRKDHTLPLNRAAAYLKLGKYEDAERDCTISLSLQPGQVKALFRRAQARAALKKPNEARDDLTQALKIDPKNNAVIVELRNLEELTSSAKPSTRKPIDVRQQKQVHALSSKSTPSESAPRRRRVPIEIVEGPYESSSSKPSFKNDSSVAAELTPASTRNIKSSKQEGIEEASTKKPVRAGGGRIFRASGEDTAANADVRKFNSILPASAPSSTVSTKGQVTSPLIASPTISPTTLFEFSRSWERDQSVTDRWKLLLSIPPAAIPPLFRTSLEAPMMVSVLETFEQILASQSNGETEKSEMVKEYMNSLARVSRFPTILMFLNTSELAIARRVCDLIGEGIVGWNI